MIIFAEEVILPFLFEWVSKAPFGSRFFCCCCCLSRFDAGGVIDDLKCQFYSESDLAPPDIKFDV